MKIGKRRMKKTMGEGVKTLIHHYYHPKAVYHTLLTLDLLRTPSRFDVGSALPPSTRHNRGKSSDTSLLAVLQEQHAMLHHILASQEA